MSAVLGQGYAPSYPVKTEADLGRELREKALDKAREDEETRWRRWLRSSPEAVVRRAAAYLAFVERSEAQPEARAEERERCARLADSHADASGTGELDDAFRRLAAAIREGKP